jgi:hypothetical protein
VPLPQRAVPLFRAAACTDRDLERRGQQGCRVAETEPLVGGGGGGGAAAGAVEVAEGSTATRAMMEMVETAVSKAEGSIMQVVPSAIQSQPRITADGIHSWLILCCARDHMQSCMMVCIPSCAKFTQLLRAHHIA